MMITDKGEMLTSH